MHTFVQKNSKSQAPAQTDGYAQREGGSHTALDNSGAAPEPSTLQERLNQSPKVQEQLHLQQALNHGPRAAAQAQLAEALSGRSGAAPAQAIQRQAALEDEEPLQSQALQREALEKEEEPLQALAMPAQRQALTEEEPLQERFAPIQQQERRTGLPDALATTQRKSAAVIQRVLDGTKFTLKLMGAIAANDFGLHSWGDGKFISYDNSDVATNNVHVHLYSADTEADEVTVSGHAIWNKRGGRNEQKLDVRAEPTEGKRWAAVLTLGDEAVAVPGANPVSKTRLYDEVVNQLTELVAGILNEDYTNSGEEEEI